MLFNFCSRIIEACWLIAIVGVPLFFNPYTSRVFEADKTYLMRSITLIMLVAWIVKIIAKPKSDSLPADKPVKKDASTYISFLVIVLAIIYLISSAFSITPYFSFKGYFLREEGFYTLICYIVIFFIMLKNMRDKNQLDRLINIIILTSTIISIYGVFQSLNIDTVTWAGGERTRVATTLGNPIFAGAFLIMVIPIIISRLIEYIDKGLGRNYVPVIFYTIILIINILCIILTKSRGPFIGFVTSLFLFVLLVARIKQIRWLFISVISVALLSIIFFVILNIQQGPFYGIKKHFGRFAEIYDMDKGSGKVRLLIWEGAISIIKSSPSRLFFGYGLESLFPLYHQHTPSSFARFEGNTIPDHSHNETFDMLITSGVLGVFVYLAIIFLVIYYALKYIGLIPSFSSRRLFILMMLVAVIVGALVPLVLQKALFLGLTVPFGFLAGFIFYLIMTWKTENITLKGENLFLLIGLICALMAHFSELQFGIGVTSTRLYFWVFIALILFIFKASSYAQESTNLPSEVADKIKSIRTSLINQSVVYGLISGLIIAFFSFELIKRKFIPEGIPSAFYYIIFTVGLFSVLFIIFTIKSKSLSLAETNQKSNITIVPFGFLILSISILWGGVFYYILISLLGDFTRVATIFITFCYLFIGLTLIILTGFIHKCDLYNNGNKNIKGSKLWIGMLVGVLLLPLAISVIYYTNLRETYADIFCQEGENYKKSQKWQESINSYKKSIELSPHTDYYYASLGHAYKSSNDYPNAIETLRNALKVNPLNPFHYIDMARFYKEWAGTFKDNPAERDSKLSLSLEAYQKLSALTPQNPLVFKEMGGIYFLKKDYEKTIEQYLHSLNLEDAYLDKEIVLRFRQEIEQYIHTVNLDSPLPGVYIFLGRVYHQIDQTDKVIGAYRKAYRLDAINTRYYFIKLGEEYFNQNRFEDSLKVNLALIDLAPTDYQHYHNASVVLDCLGRIDEAIEYSHKAIDLVPLPMQKEGVRKFLKKLEEKKKIK
jgi:tetratricopeptide (TPR) repeat protein/O-antigen ligase